MAQPSRIIGITGYAQHGKDSVARFLKKYGYRQYAFADVLKSLALTLNPIIPEEFDNIRLAEYVERWGWEEAKKNGEVRRFLQVLGTEGVRNHLGNDAWIRALEKKMGTKLTDRRSNVVVSDVRFQNEATWIKSMGGDMWRVRRYVKTPDGMEDFENGVGENHESERDIKNLPADIVLRAWNLKTLEKEVDRSFEEGVPVA